MPRTRAGSKNEAKRNLLRVRLHRTVGILLIGLAIIYNPFTVSAFYPGYVFNFGINTQIYFIEFCLAVMGILIFNLGLVRKNIRSYASRKNIAFVVIFLLIIFVAAELTLRAFTPTSFYTEEPLFYPMPYIMHANRPNYEFCRPANAMLDESNAGKEMCYSFNELGFRGELPSEDKGDEYRIIFLGGSAAFNGEPLENSIAKKLEKYLREKGLANVKAYNWGVTSYNSAQELSVLVHDALDFHPDMVVVYDGANELQQYFYDPRPGYPHAYASTEKAIQFFSNETNSLDIPDLFLLAVRRLQSIRFLTERVFRSDLDYRFTGIYELREHVGYGTPEWENEIVRTYAKNIDKMSMISESGNFRLEVFLQPLVHFKEPLVGNEADMLSSLDFQRFVRSAYPAMAADLEAISDSYPENEYYDFRDILNYDKQFFFDYIHINHEGNDIVGKEMADRLYAAVAEDMGVE
ncbi:MAG: hypothetical protein JXC85_04830 [Candidatus Aenigmarchaeota archaeon]|nr:hypothetical protein [Candidatus Aenigmarchaeota archaeon]